MTDDEGKSEKPGIRCRESGPYIVENLETLSNSRGDALKASQVTALCRCGGSGKKPYCDGTHAKIGFIAEKSPDRVPDRVKEYDGRKITIVDNRGVCSHSEECIRNLPAVFRKFSHPWIDPDGAGVKEIIETIRKCPSGALSYRLGGKRLGDLDREPAIRVAKNGPLEVVGGIGLKDHLGSTPESKEHYTLCRCGASKNKPFCDGMHHTVGFEDSAN